MGAEATDPEYEEASESSTSGANQAPLIVPDLSGQIVGGRYRILRPLAKGGMSRVFLADQIDLKRKVVVKFLRAPVDDPAQRALWARRFAREVEALAGLSHPNIIVAHEYNTTETGLTYVVTEYAEGETLATYVKGNAGGLHPSEAVWIAIQIASALDEAHSQGIVHRDLKPQNVIVQRGRSMRIKVLDFGLVKTVAEVGTDLCELTDAGIRVGSPHYMSPEQVKGGDITFATDVYALGCLLHFMITGQAPFPGRDPIAVMVAHVNTPPPALRIANPQCSPSKELSDVVMRCIQKDPAVRYQTMSELARVLGACPEGAHMSSAPISDSWSLVAPSSSSAEILVPATPTFSATVAAPSAERPNRRNKAIIAGAVAFGVVAGLVLALMIGWNAASSNENASTIESAPMQRPARQTVDVELASAPPGATVRRNGVVLGTTPLRISVAGDETIPVELALSGYQEARLQLSAGATHPMFRLTPVVVAGAVIPERTAESPEEHSNLSRGSSPRSGRSRGRSEPGEAQDPPARQGTQHPVSQPQEPPQESPAEANRRRPHTDEPPSDNLDPWAD